MGPISKASFSSIPTCYATVSVGTPDHDLKDKLKAIAYAGFKGIELGFPDLLAFASKRVSRDLGPLGFDVLCSYGLEIQRMCKELCLRVVMLQPFANFEGWKPQSEERKDAFKRAKGWIRIMEAVGSSDAPISIARDLAVADLKELADLLAAHDFRLAYVNWCWSTHAPDWTDMLDIVKRVDRPNIGLCLDKFQTAGGEWADPTTNSGLLESRGNREEMEERFHESLRSLATTIPPQKIYLLQISDAYKPNEPLDPTPDESEPRPRGRWSSCLRPVPFDGGYLPVVDVAKAVLETGFRNWFSIEVFDAGPDGQDQDWKDMPAYTKKAWKSFDRLRDEVVNVMNA